jgi:hypothetical protein
MRRRPVHKCQECGDPREIVSHGLCAKCLMSMRREADRRGEPVFDPCQYAYLQELNSYLNRLVRASSALEDAPVPDIFVTPADLLYVRRVLREAVEKVQAVKATTEQSGVEADVEPGSQEDPVNALTTRSG